jgi:hypothetical protein
MIGPSAQNLQMRVKLRAARGKHREPKSPKACEAQAKVARSCAARNTALAASGEARS